MNLNPELQDQDLAEPALRKVAPPVDFGPLKAFLFKEFGIENFSPANEDLLVASDSVSDQTYGFDRVVKGSGLFFFENKILDRVPDGGQYKHLEELERTSQHITTAIFHLSGKWYHCPKTGLVAYWFDPIAVRVYRPTALLKWPRIEATREQLFRGIGNWVRTKKFYFEGK